MNVLAGRIFPLCICTQFLLSSQVFIFYKFGFSLYEFLLSVSCFIRFIAKVMAPYMLNTYQHTSSAHLASFSCQILIYTSSKFSTHISSSFSPQKGLQAERIQQWGHFIHYYSPIVPCIILLCFSFSTLVLFLIFTMGIDEVSPFQGIMACFFKADHAVFKLIGNGL